MCCSVQGKDAALRQQVRQGKVSTPKYGEVQLDYDPDQLLVSVGLCSVALYRLQDRTK
jgi:hypothetical protein